MATQLRTLSLEERFESLRIGLAGLGLLALDDLWTEAVADRDPVAAKIGNQVLHRLNAFSERSSWLEQALSRVRTELNAYWPALRDHWLPSAKAEIKELDAWIGEYGGLGDASVSVATALHGELIEEAAILSGKLADLAQGKEVTTDLRINTRILVGVAVVGLLVSAAMPIVAVVVGASGVTAASLASISTLAASAAGIAGGAIIQAKTPPSPAPS